MKLQPQTTILFQGDSVTDAFRKPAEINPAYQMGNGYVFLLGSRLAATFPQTHIRLINRAVSGNNLANVAARWQVDALDLEPDVISLLVGVNDTLTPGPETGIAHFSALYRSLLERTYKDIPGVRFILAEPFLLKCGEVTDIQIEDVRKRQSVISQLARQFDATFIPAQQLFSDACHIAPPEYWAYDGIHPTAAGHWLLAEKWREVLEIEK